MIEGCAFILKSGSCCDAAIERPRRSAYCDHHYKVCHLAPGSAAERRVLGDIERMSKWVGGRQSHGHIGPSLGFMVKLERLVRRELSR
jgi:hypothetical protein